MAMSFLSNLVLKPLRSLTGGDPHPPDSIAVQHAFIHDFTDHYCNENDEDSERPPFSPDKWDDVLKASKRDGKFVFIYLHSTMHDDTQQFCEEALRDAGVLEFMHSGQALVWGADVRHRDGSEVAGFLKACAFPFVAVCMKHQSGALLVLDRVEGLAALGADENTTLGAKLLARLTGVVAANQQVVSEVRDVNRAEQERRSFREQQDQEYQDTLRADRERVRDPFVWFI
jgi:FAS-associated factor 2